MGNNKTLKVAVALKNGDYHKVNTDTLDMDTNGITIYPTAGGSISVQFEQIELMSIFTNDNSDEQLVFKSVKEPKVKREE